MKKLLLLIALLSSLMITTTSWATLGPPVKISRGAGQPFAAAEEAYEGTFLIETAAVLEVELISVEGQGWSQTFLNSEPLLRMSAQDSYEVTFGGTASATAGSLYLRYAINGALFKKTLDPGPIVAAKRERHTAMVAPRTAPRKEKTSSWQGSGLEPAVPPKSKRKSAETKTIFDESYDIARADKRAPTSRTITVTGRVYFVEPAFGSSHPAEPNRSARGATVNLYDEDSTWDEFLGSDLTNDDGEFSITITWDPCFSCDSTPDLYVNVETANSRIDVESSILELTYYFDTPTWDDYTGSTLDIGDMRFADLENQPTLFILTHATRAFGLINDTSNREQDTVDYQYPGDGNYYNNFFEEIHITEERGFWSDTIIHEYGHHFIENFGAKGDIEYCNDICDADFAGDDCGHCLWCPESVDVAWSEGWSNWLADFYGRFHTATYGYVARHPRVMELTQACGALNFPGVGPFHTTEARFAALLRDLEDTTNENDPLNGVFVDAMSDDPVRIFAVTDLDEPTTPSQFFVAYRARYTLPEPALWETATNAGYPNYDLTKPTPPQNFESQSHAVGVPTPSRRIFINWDASIDAVSQVEKYVYVFSVGAPVTPSTFATGSSNLFGKSTQLLPGTYYANVVAQDRAGNWSDPISLGPYIITELPDPDLAFTPRTGWAEPVIPFGNSNLTETNVPAPIFLVGNSDSATYWNAVVSAPGPSGVPTGTNLKIYVDGQPIEHLPWETIDDEVELGAFNEASEILVNRGPVGVRGGRHVFAARADVLNEVIESDEDNNVSGKSWVWSPKPMTVDTDILRAVPPNPIDGWTDITSGVLRFSCDGFVFQSTGWWNAVTLVPTDPNSDYDLRLHDPSSGASDGFISPLGFSMRSNGLTDVVLVNKNLNSQQFWDVAVWRVPVVSDNQSFTVRHVVSTTFAYGDSIGVAAGAGEMMTLHEVYVPAQSVGPMEITVRTDPAQGPLRVSFFDASFERGDIHDDDAFAITDQYGFARLQVSTPVANYYCVAVYRDANDGNGTAAENYSVEIGAPGVDIAAYTPPNWTSPLIPWEDTDDLNGPIVAPASLNGFDDTYVHSATRNLSPLPSPGPYVQRLYLDDDLLVSPVLAGGYGGADSLKVATLTNIPGGRHTLWMRADFTNWDVLDTDLSSNYWAEQWVWSPLVMTLNVPQSLAEPGDPTGGWTAFVNPNQSVPELFFNCVGLRTPLLQSAGLDGNWAAIVATPVDTVGNLDLQLHDQLSTGAKSGFDTPFVTSAAGGIGQTEFVIFNPSSLGKAQLDAGVLENSGNAPTSGGFSAMVTNSQYLGVDGVPPTGVYGPWVLLPERTMQLFEVWLDAGSYGFTLNNLTGGANLGVSLHGGAASFTRDSTNGVSGTAWLAPAGADDYLGIAVDQAGYYALAVWKTGADDLYLTSQFSLSIEAGSVSGVIPGSQNLTTRIAEVSPNPFNPRTTVGFVIEQAGEAEVAIYDLRGQLVKVLHRGYLPSGPNERVWQGRDDRGRTVATGTYLVRLRSGGKIDHRKILLLK